MDPTELQGFITGGDYMYVGPTIISVFQMLTKLTIERLSAKVWIAICA